MANEIQHVDAAIRSGRIGWDDVVDLWKLTLYDDHKTADITKEVTEQLKGRGTETVENLISVHLTAVLQEANTQIRELVALDYDGDFDSLSIKVFVSVPQMWTIKSNQVMVEAVKAAGVPWAELVYEHQWSKTHQQIACYTRPNCLLNPANTRASSVSWFESCTSRVSTTLIGLV